jgi:hypothetical protein
MTTAATIDTRDLARSATRFLHDRDLDHDGWVIAENQFGEVVIEHREHGLSWSLDPRREVGSAIRLALFELGERVRRDRIPMVAWRKQRVFRDRLRELDRALKVINYAMRDSTEIVATWESSR